MLLLSLRQVNVFSDTFMRLWVAAESWNHAAEQKTFFLSSEVQPFMSPDFLGEALHEPSPSEPSLA